ncbi:MAG: class I SAM-dependent methyltransferase [Verrucomicrobia bacterium]|nr:class I SAM-dependent methyltransferase [Verrucomicrobiota bacterium]
MSACVLYYNRGTSCCVRLLTSIFSLRKHYSGPVKLMQEGELPAQFAALLAELRVEIRPLPPSADTVLVAKAALWRQMEDDHAMFLDADTIVRGPVEEFLEWTREFGFVATWFNGWRTDSPRMTRRITEWNKVAPELVPPALAYGKAINSGVQGWSKGAAILPAYEELTRRGVAAECNRLMVDELALQLLLPHHRHFLAHHVWNTSGAFGDIEQARIVHYHGRKHCQPDNPRCDLWKEHYFELLASFPKHADTLRESWGDRRLARFHKTLRRRKDLTVVTAVDPQYAARLKENIRAWMRLPGLKEQRFLIFVNGFQGSHEREFLDYPNVKIVRWEYPHPAASRREFMLAAFLPGVARHVETEYWMKLDADCHPHRPWWEWPDYANHTVVSHRWGFTRMKGDAAATQHWFNRLDEVFSPQQPRFKTRFEVTDKPVSHRPGNAHGLPLRFNSFCHIEKTAFTRRMAEHLERTNGGRMAIPSQDTTSWYCATLWQEPVKLVNMKRWFDNRRSVTTTKTVRDLRCHEVYDCFMASQDKLLDVEWLTYFLMPHCRYPRLNWHGTRLRIVQYPAEFARFLVFLARNHVRSYVEIGVSTGGSLFMVDSYLRAAVPNYERTVGYDRTSKLRDWEAYRQRFGSIEFRPQNSKDINLAGESFDAAFIDANHSEPWVLQDFEKVRAHCRLAGFHDIVLAGASVDKAWQQIKSQHQRHWEFIETRLPPECRCGIGVVAVRETPDLWTGET